MSSFLANVWLIFLLMTEHRVGWELFRLIQNSRA